MELDFPKNIDNVNDVIKIYAQYRKEKKLGKIKNWGKCIGFVKNKQKEKYSLQEIATVVWGVLTTTDKKIDSIFYCNYSFDKLDYYKKLKQKENSSISSETSEEILNMEVYTNIKEEEGILDEFL